MISDDVCSPLSLGEGWGEAPIKVSALPISSSARKRETPPVLPLFAYIAEYFARKSREKREVFLHH